MSAGYKLPFASQANKYSLKNNKFSLKHSDFVSPAISELLTAKCVTHCVNPLTVAEEKTLRLVLDLRHVNEFLVVPLSQGFGRPPGRNP